MQKFNLANIFWACSIVVLIARGRSGRSIALFWEQYRSCEGSLREESETLTRLRWINFLNCHLNALNLSYNLVIADYNNIGKFLNRILGMEVHQQNALFQYFADTLTAVVQNAKKNGRYDMGILGKLGNF